MQFPYASEVRFDSLTAFKQNTICLVRTFFSHFDCKSEEASCTGRQRHLYLLLSQSVSISRHKCITLKCHFAHLSLRTMQWSRIRISCAPTVTICDMSLEWINTKTCRMVYEPLPLINGPLSSNNEQQIQMTMVPIVNRQIDSNIKTYLHSTDSYRDQKIQNM